MLAYELVEELKDGFESITDDGPAEPSFSAHERTRFKLQSNNPICSVSEGEARMYVGKCMNLLFQPEIFINSGISKGNPAYNTYYNNTFVEVDGMDGRGYLEMVAKSHPEIKMDKNILGGMPSIIGTRIHVSLILACLRDGMNIDEIMEDYSVSNRELVASIDFAIDLLDRPFLGD